MYRIDDTNDNHNETPSSIQAMESSMGYIFDNFISPMEHELTNEQMELLAHIGIAFRIIAEKAQAYEDMVEGNGGDFLKN